MFRSVVQDVRLAFRLFRRTPVPTGIALLSIALSVGAAAVVFAAVKAVLIDPLPYARPAELVQLGTGFAVGGQSHSDWIFWDDAQEVMRRNRTLKSVGVYGNAVFDLSGDSSSPPEALYGVRMSASLFPTLGVAPMFGRNILPEEEQTGRNHEMILSYGLWTRRFNSDRGVIGRTVKVNGHDCVVIGVMPPEFNFPLRRAAAHTPYPYVEFWTPLHAGPDTHKGAFGVVARLRPGVSLVEAQQDLDSISAALAREFPATNRERRLHMGRLRDRIVGGARNALWLLLAAAVLFLLIGCANVANLLLARGLARRREIAVRMAIGAGGVRIVRQLLTESCVLAILGGLGGYSLTALAWRILPAIAPVSIPRLAAARADTSILAFALVVALVNGIVFGMAPALRAASWRTALAIHNLGGRGAAAGQQDRLRTALVMAEVAVTVTLVVIGGQLLAGFVALLRTDPGFQADRVLASVVLPAPERYATAESHAVLYRRFLEAVRALAGVESAGTVDALPFSGENHGGFVSAGETRLNAEIDVVGGEYLQAMGIRLAAGRWFLEEEMKPGADAAIVDDVAAARLWPGESAIGKRICVYCTPERPSNWKRVVGVVSGIRHAALDEPAPANVYLAAGAMESAVFLVVRTNRPPEDLAKGIRRAVAAIDPNQPVLLSASMRSLVADSIADRRFILSLLAATGCLALAMSVAGVYGVSAYTTSRRTEEIGLRMALGATPGDIRGMIFRQGFLTVAAGLVLGLGLTLPLLRVLRGVLLGLESANTAHIGMAAAVVSVSAAIACWMPARRAMRIDPMAALREE